MKLAATVILFNPPLEVYDNIMSYYNYIDRLIIIDNSFQEDLLLTGRLSKLDKAYYFPERSNIGIAKALNMAAGNAIEAGFDWLLTMDQDSSFDAKDFARYINYLENLNQESLPGMVGVNYVNQPLIDDTIAESVSHLITSGSVLNLIAYKKVGPFDERFFIDEVDAEYCYRLRLNNFKICMYKDCFMKHSLGENIVVRNWFIGPKVRRNIHAPLRIYYMVRNFLLLSSMYKKKFPAEFNANAKILFNRIKNAFLYTGKRYSVTRYFFRGLIDYHKRRFGKFK